MVNCASHLNEPGIAHTAHKTLFPGCLWGCFLMRLTLESLESEVDCPPECGWCHLVYEYTTFKKKAVERGIDPFYFLSPCLSWDTGFLLPLNWDLHHQCPWFPGFRMWPEITLLALLSHHLASGRSRDFSAFITAWAHFSLCISIDIDMDINVLVFLENPNAVAIR